MKTPSFHSPARRTRRSFAFNLIEMLVVIAVISVLAGLLIPALSNATTRARSISCLNQLGQLQLCWQMYTGDHREFIPPNDAAGAFSVVGSWVEGDARLDRDTRHIERGILFQYNNSKQIYRCPDDDSTVLGAPTVPRSRSYSMSTGLAHHHPSFKTVLLTMSEIQDPSPANALVFVDENANSIQNGSLAIFRPASQRFAFWNLPADRHLYGANLTFADGHAEHWRWKDEGMRANTELIRQKPTDPVTGVMPYMAVDPDDRDLRRLMATGPRE